MRYFYCQNPCFASGGCYITNQTCITNLTYSCYVIEGSSCVQKTDYNTCVAGSNYYNNLTACQENLPSGSSTTTTGTVETGGTLKEKLGKEVFTIAGYEITVFHLIIALIIVLLGLYLMGAFGKK